MHSQSVHGTTLVIIGTYPIPNLTTTARSIDTRSTTSSTFTRRRRSSRGRRSRISNGQIIAMDRGRTAIAVETATFGFDGTFPVAHLTVAAGSSEGWLGRDGGWCFRCWFCTLVTTYASVYDIICNTIGAHNMNEMN